MKTMQQQPFNDNLVEKAAYLKVLQGTISGCTQKKL
jgi:hypothetical protein